jgi:hypothetical protein
MGVRTQFGSACNHSSNTQTNSTQQGLTTINCGYLWVRRLDSMLANKTLDYWLDWTWVLGLGFWSDSKSVNWSCLEQNSGADLVMYWVLCSVMY